MRLAAFAPMAALVLTGLVYSTTAPREADAHSRPMTPATADQICAPFLEASGRRL